jgi:thiol-disulfide isomerase/thioredoxin
MKIKIAESAFLLALLTLSGCTNNHPAEKITTDSKNARVASDVSVGLEIGQRAPELAFSDPEGKIISLSSLKGKMVLIDFWASWCMPCRIENPNLVKVYEQYSDGKFKAGKGFTIYSVSLDTDKEAWMRGITMDGLKWDSHVSDLKGWSASPAALYNVLSIPANFLIDGNGIIVAKDLRAEALGLMMESLLK